MAAFDAVGAPVIIDLSADYRRRGVLRAPELTGADSGQRPQPPWLLATACSWGRADADALAVRFSARVRAIPAPNFAWQERPHKLRDN